MAHAQLRRDWSRTSHRTSAFAAFLSDSSDDEDEDDAHARATLRMQHQAEDSFYQDSSLERGATRKDHDTTRYSFRSALATRRGLDGRETKKSSRSDRVMAKTHVALGGGGGGGLGRTLHDGDRCCVTGGTNDAARIDSVASSPPSLDLDDDSFFDAVKPSFSDEHSFGGEESFQAVDTSFVYRPSLLDDDDDAGEVQGQDQETGSSFCGTRVRLPDTSLPPSLRSRTHEFTANEAPAKDPITNTSDMDTTTPTSTNHFVRTTRGQTLKCAGTHGSGHRSAQGAVETKNVGHATAIAAITSTSATKPVLVVSRQSSATSSSRSSHVFISQQQQLAAAHECWRISSLDLSESKHAFDEELGPLFGQQQSLQASAVHFRNEQQSFRLSSTHEEHNGLKSTSSNMSSFTSLHCPASFFVDDMQQNIPLVSSPSLDSPGEDSFTNVAILGDDVRDRHERRSSDILPQNAGEFRSNSVSAVHPSASGATDLSYSNVMDAAVPLDRIFSKPVNYEGFYPVDVNDSSANKSAKGTSVGDSSALSAVSQSSTTSNELPFVSFGVAKPATSSKLTKQQNQRETMEQRSLSTALGNHCRPKASYEAGQVLYRSIALPRGEGVKTGKPSKFPSKAPSGYSTGATNFSSAALLAAIKMQDIHTDARSEETEADDVALGRLPHLAPPLKIIPAPQGGLLSSNSVAESSPSALASRLALLSNTRSSTRSSSVSSTSSADRLDFTGVYRGSIKSPMSLDNHDIPSRHIRPEAETLLMKSQQKSLGGRKDPFSLECLGLKLERSKSDGRSVQRESRRKVENFFRDRHQRNVLDIDGQAMHRVTNRKLRARTTVVQYVDNVVEGPQSFASHSTMAAKVVELKNLCNGGKRLGWHLQYDAVPLTLQQEEECAKHRAMNLTIGTTSTGTTATPSMPSDHFTMPRNYMASPQAPEAVEVKPHAKENVHASQCRAAANANGFYSAPSGPGGDDASRSGAMSGRQAHNVSRARALPRLSGNELPAFYPSPCAITFATPGFGGSAGAGSGRSSGKSPVVFAATSRGFLRKSSSSFNGLNEASGDSLFDASPAISQRPKLVDRMQSVSNSVASSRQRHLHSKEPDGQNGNVHLTSPRSQSTVPAALPRAYNHNGFYEIPFKVPAPNKPLRQREKQQQFAKSDRDWVRRWLILVTCALSGLCAGAILVHVVALKASIFNLSAAEVHDRQESNGELVFAAGVRWCLLPGHLFLRIWSAVVVPLLVCYVVNAMSDLVGYADKATRVLSFRSIGYAMMLAMLATAEGVLAMWMTHTFGWFRGSSSTARSEASLLSDAIGVTPLPEGTVGLQCIGDGEYLRRLGHDVFTCSDASLLLPLYEEVSTKSTVISGSGPAVFALQEVTRVFATPTSSTAYYPVSLGAGGNTAASLLLSLSPANLAARYAEVASDGMAPLSSLVVFALLLGYVCGKRIRRLRRGAPVAIVGSIETNDTATEEPRQVCHYILGLFVELQLALEWMVRPLEQYLAPIGFFSVMLGHMVSHHREWRSLTSSMASLIVGVLSLLTVHAVLVLPMLFKQCFRSRPRLPLLRTMRAFVPAFVFAFTTDHVALSAPVTMQCYARVLTVTRSTAQVTTAVTAAITRNARALYLPLLLLWLLETSSSEKLELSVSDYVSTAMLSFLSCFCGGSSRLTLAMARTLWSIQSATSASALPATMPLLVVCDVVLARFASVVTLVDHVVLTHLVAQHGGETVVHGPPDRLGNSNISSASPLDDSQGYHPLSSAMLSSVCL